MLTSTLNENKLSSAANSIYKNKANSTYNTYIQATPSMPTPKNTKVHGFQQSSATTFATIRASSVYAIVATPLKKENPSQERKPLPKCLKKNKGVWNVLNSYGQELSCIDLGNPQKSPVTKKTKKKTRNLEASTKEMLHRVLSEMASLQSNGGSQGDQGFLYTIP